MSWCGFKGLTARVRWAVSIKSGQQIGRVVSADFVEKAWKEVLGRSDSDFVPDRDLVGLVIPPLGGGVRSRLDELIRLAEYQDPVNLDSEMDREAGRERRELWNSLRGPDDADRVSSSPGGACQTVSLS